jgi:hypothetical protein
MSVARTAGAAGGWRITRGYVSRKRKDYDAERPTAPHFFANVDFSVCSCFHRVWSFRLRRFKIQLAGADEGAILAFVPRAQES